MKVTVAGAGGFIGGHLVQRLLAEGHRVDAYDIKPLDDWHQIHPAARNSGNWDLRNPVNCRAITLGIDQVFDLAADMGGMGFIETHKLDCMRSVLISANLLETAWYNGVEQFLFASSACIYPSYRQHTTDVEALRESDAYPADPEDGYGWEKLFSERLCRHYTEETSLQCRIARFHNIYGPEGTWDGGREKAPAAICRKVAEAKLTGNPQIEIWGDGKQTRSFCYVDDAVEGMIRLMGSDYSEPLNIGSSEMVSINQLVRLTKEIAGLDELLVNHVDGPLGVRGRSSDNTLCQETLDWEPSITLADGMARLYEWVEAQVAASLGAITTPLR